MATYYFHLCPSLTQRGRHWLQQLPRSRHCSLQVAESGCTDSEFGRLWQSNLQNNWYFVRWTIQKGPPCLAKQRLLTEACQRQKRHGEQCCPIELCYPLLFPCDPSLRCYLSPEMGYHEEARRPFRRLVLDPSLPRSSKHPDSPEVQS